MLAWSLTRDVNSLEWAIENGKNETLAAVVADLETKRQDCLSSPDRAFGEVKISVRTLLDDGTERRGLRIRYIERFYWDLLATMPTLANQWKELAATTAVVGEPLTAGDYTIVARSADGKDLSEARQISVRRRRSSTCPCDDSCRKNGEKSGALLNARKEPWLHAAVALVVIASAMLLSPPIELMEPNRLLIVALATTANVAVVLPCMYVFIRYPQRGYWTWWAGLSSATIVALAASLVKYQNLRSTYSVYVHGISVVVGTNDELTTLGKMHFEQLGELPKTMVEKIGQPGIVWEPSALKRHARQLERNYYLCEALIGLLGMSVIGVWRARRTMSGLVGTAPIESQRRISNAQGRRKRFQVALSYPGEVRDRVSSIASILEGTLGREAIFYDRWYAGEPARPNLDLYLQNIYKQDSELLVIVLCAEYEAKDWCGLEWRVVRELIKHREADRIMLLRLDNAPISGLLSIDGYLDIAALSDEQVANLILSRITNPTVASHVN